MSISSATSLGGSLLLAEIAQQPLLWPTTLDIVKSASVPNGMAAENVLFTGAGTSAYAASAIVEGWPGARAIPTTDLLVQPVEELRAVIPEIIQGGVLISLARSGDSPESAAVVQRFQKNFPEIRHVAIVCNANGKLAQLPGLHAICLDPRTNDASLAMTGSFSNLVLAGLALRSNQELEQDLPLICERVTQSLATTTDTLEQIAKACKDRVVVLASGMQALCKEAALKIVELTAGRVLAMPETFLGFRHGAVGFLRDDTPVLCFMSSDPQKRAYENDVIEDLRSKGLGRLVLIGNGDLPVAAEEWSLTPNAAELPDALRTPFEIVFAQSLAYHLSVATGVDPDNPSPKGTITRVVRPFRIHEELASTSR